MDCIIIEREGNIGRITLNRPDVFNSFNKELSLSLLNALDQMEAEDNIRVIVLTGQGRAFCAGQDLIEATDPDGESIEALVTQHYNPIVTKIRAIEKPILAAVNGVAAGAGANIALACDIVVAHEKASFIQAFSKIGLVPDSGGTWTLPRLIGPQLATALIMLGDKVSASEAAKMGMIYKCIGSDEYEITVKSIAEKLSKLPTRGLGLTKRALNASYDNSFIEQLEVEKICQKLASETYDYNEGVNAFLEKREPRFKGK